MELGLKLKQIHDCIQKRANSDMQEMDLTFSQHHVIICLAHREGYTAELKELEREFRVSQPTMAGIVQRLEAKGYVEPLAHPTDRRIKMIRLTPGGLELSERSHQKLRRRRQEMVADLTPEEQETLERLLDKVYQNLVNID